MILGFVTNVVLWQMPGGHLLGVTVPRVAFTWYVLIGSAVTFAVGSAASLLTRQTVRRAGVSGVMLVALAAAGSGSWAECSDCGEYADGGVQRGRSGDRGCDRGAQDAGGGSAGGACRVGGV